MRLKRKETAGRRKLARNRSTGRVMDVKTGTRHCQPIVFVEEGETSRSLGSYAPASHPLSIRRVEEDDDQD